MHAGVASGPVAGVQLPRRVETCLLPQAALT
jgi:hypothetical protein